MERSSFSLSFSRSLYFITTAVLAHSADFYIWFFCWGLHWEKQQRDRSFCLTGMCRGLTFNTRLLPSYLTSLCQQAYLFFSFPPRILFQLPLQCISTLLRTHSRRWWIPHSKKIHPNSLLGLLTIALYLWSFISDILPLHCRYHVLHALLPSRPSQCWTEDSLFSPLLCPIVFPLS